MISTTVLSYLDSSLAKFTNEIEKEEVAAFNAKLRRAIVNFVATDSFASPPQVPTHTQPDEGNGKANDINMTKKIAIATPLIVLSKAVNRRIIKELDLPTQNPLNQP